MNSKIIDLIKTRLEIGAKEYEQEVDIHDGRNWETETLEELLDACVYLAARLLQLNDKRTCNELPKVIDYSPTSRVQMSGTDTEKIITALDEMSSTLYLSGDNAESSEYAGLARKLRDASNHKEKYQIDDCKTCD